MVPLQSAPVRTVLELFQDSGVPRAFMIRGLVALSAMASLVDPSMPLGFHFKPKSMLKLLSRCCVPVGIT